MKRFRTELRTHGLTDQQGRILRVLGDGRPLEMLELSEQASILPASLSRIIPNMEKKRLVKRQKLSRDGRRVAVSITPTGFDVFKIVSRKSESIYRELRDRVGAGRIRDLYRTLDALIEFGDGE